MNLFTKLFGGDKPKEDSKIVCIWMGTFDSEEAFYKDYLSFPCVDEDEDDEDDEDDDNEEIHLSKFAKDAELGWYDEDFIESWWFEKLEISKLLEYRASLLDSDYFFDDLITELTTQDISNYNTITFLFGKKECNEKLFNYKNPFKKDVPIKFILKKQYQ